ncbi:hypothetical protein K3495_g16539, partial [Podosphaera aphanis]
MIQIPLYIMGHQHFVLHGIGTVDTGAFYIRSDPFIEDDWHYHWRDMGYIWSNVVDWSDAIPVFRMCRDKTALPDYYHLLTTSYAKAKLEDVAVKNGIPRWLEIFQHLHGDTTSEDDDIFRQNTLSPRCNSLNTDKCTIKDIVKLVHMGVLAVDGEYNCFIEGVKPENGDIPTYKFDELLPIGDIVDTA